MGYRHVLTVAGGAFNASLTGLCCGAGRQLYVCGDSRICVFDAKGALQRSWSASRPVLSIAIRNDGAVFAGQAGQIEIFNRAGERSGMVSDAGLGEVTAIAFIGRTLFAADATERCVKRYDGLNKPVHKIGLNNRTNGFAIPNGVLDLTVDSSGVLCVANPGKHRIERYTPDGELLGHIGRFGQNDPSGFPGCCNPTNVTFGAGRFYVTEKAGPRAKVLDSHGGLIGVIAADAFHPNSKNMRVAIDGGDRVYVADTVRRTVLAFEPEQAL
jgi:sugar lactone lactonase YvrE